MRKSFGDYVKSIDLYGEPVGINYKGSGTYNTYFGAFLSFFTFSLMVYYGALKTSILLDKNQPTTTYNTGVISDMNKEIGEKVTGQKGEYLMDADKLNFGLAFYLMT